MSTISGTVTQPVQLGVGGYSTALTITTSGAVAPATAGANAVTAGPGLAGIRINNQGHITGGAQHTNKAGGIGIQVSSAGTLVNSGVISGGSNDGSNGGGAGGAGVMLNAGAYLSNTGSILGGTARYGGNGVDLTGAASLLNAGTIDAGGGAIGVDLSQASSLANHGTISGGAGGIGLEVGAGCTATNFQAIVANTGQYISGPGAEVLAGGSLSNLGTITGGDGGYRQHYTYPGSAGVLVQGGTLTNSGLLQGFQASYTGPGLTVDSGLVTNTGRIAGADIYGGSVVNSGKITAGVQLDGGTLTTSGAIGVPGQNASYAVQVAPTDATATLLVEAGATFNGTVQAMPGGVSILELGGATAGTLGLLGTEYTGFDIIEVASGSDWTLQKANTVAADTSFFVNGQLTVSGLFQDAGALNLRSFGEFTVSSGAAARAVTVNLQGGTLAAGAGGRLAVGNNVSASQPGAITVDAGGTISGYGFITAPAGLVDNGIIVAQAHTGSGGPPGIEVAGSVSGTGVIDIGARAYLSAGSLTVAKLAFLGSGGQLSVEAGQSATQISGFGTGDMITLNGVAADTASYANGTLSLYEGTSLVDQLHLVGPYTSANFAVSTVGTYAITNIAYAANGAAGGHASATSLQDEGVGSIWRAAVLTGHAHAVS